MSVGFPKFDYVLTVYAFLGSATFTALFFLIQSKDIVKSYDFFVLITSMASILFLLAVIGRLNISNGRIKSDTTYGSVVGYFALFGFGLMLLVVVLLVFEINAILGIILGVFTFTTYLILDITARRAH